jgi:CRP-like cAMP-binding protein
MNGTFSCTECTLKQCIVKRFCNAKWQALLSENKNHFVYQKGDYIFREQDRIFGLYMVYSGKVKIVSTGENHKEKIVSLATTAYPLGHWGTSVQTYLVGAFALDETHVCFFDSDMIYEAFMNNPKLTFAMMMFYSQELQKMEVRERYLSQMNACEKVAEMLLYLKEIFGTNPEDQCLNVILSRQEMADLAGGCPEQLMRELTDFENKQLIAKKGKQIALTNVEGLTEMIAHHNLAIYSNLWKYPLN